MHTYAHTEVHVHTHMSLRAPNLQGLVTIDRTCLASHLFPKRGEPMLLIDGAYRFKMTSSLLYFQMQQSFSILKDIKKQKGLKVSCLENTSSPPS